MCGSLSRAGAAVVTVIVLLALATTAPADVTITYQGETADMTSYGGSNASDLQWDYVYDLGGWTMTEGPFYWGIYTSYQIESGDIFAPSGWSGVWDSSITSGDYGGAFAGTELEGRRGMVWTVENLFSNTRTGFHFRSTVGPYERWWAAGGGTNVGEGMEYTAAPEPTSLALTSLGIVGLAAWRRRRTAR